MHSEENIQKFEKQCKELENLHKSNADKLKKKKRNIQVDKPTNELSQQGRLEKAKKIKEAKKAREDVLEKIQHLGTATLCSLMSLAVSYQMIPF